MPRNLPLASWANAHSSIPASAFRAGSNGVESLRLNVSPRSSEYQARSWVYAPACPQNTIRVRPPPPPPLPCIAVSAGSWMASAAPGPGNACVAQDLPSQGSSDRGLVQPA